MAASPEYDAVSTRTSVLVSAIAGWFDDCVEHLRDRGLISVAVYTRATDTQSNLDNQLRAKDVVKNIMATVNANKLKFYTLLEVLEKVGLLDAAKALKDKFEECGGVMPKKSKGEAPRVQTDSQEYAEEASRVQTYSQEYAGAAAVVQTGSQNYAEEKPYKDLQCSEIKNPKPRQQDFDYNKFCKHVEYIIAVINDNEFNAATTVISSPEPGFDQLTSYQVCVYLGKIGQHPVGLIHCEPGRECATTLNECINYFPNAKFLIGAGVCYGFDYDKVKFGDVIISKRIEDFGPLKVGKMGGIESRGPQINMLHKIKEIFCTNANVDNEFPVASKVHSPSEFRSARYYVGTVVSHNVLVNNKDMKKNIQITSPSAYGGEMEGGELLRIQQKKNIEVILIKAVTDYGDGTKGKEWQFIGAQAAFNYVKYKLSIQSVSEVEQGHTTPGPGGAGQNDRETARSFEAAPTQRIVTDGGPLSKTGAAAVVQTGSQDYAGIVHTERTVIDGPVSTEGNDGEGFTAQTLQPLTSATAGQSTAQPSHNPHDQTILDILQHLEIDMDKLKQRPDDNILKKIAKMIPSNDWEMYALELIQKQKMIDDIKADYSRIQDQRYQVLMQWRKKRGIRATFKELVDTFVKEDQDLATEVCELLK